MRRCSGSPAACRRINQQGQPRAQNPSPPPISSRASRHAVVHLFLSWLLTSRLDPAAKRVSRHALDGLARGSGGGSSIVHLAARITSRSDVWSVSGPHPYKALRPGRCQVSASSSSHTSRPSLTARAAITSAAAGSAHHHPSQALRPKPIRAAPEVKAQKALSAASAMRVRLPRARPVRCLAQASDGITSKAAAVTARPSTDCSGLAWLIRASMLSAVRYAASTKNETPGDPCRYHRSPAALLSPVARASSRCRFRP